MKAILLYIYLLGLVLTIQCIDFSFLHNPEFYNSPELLKHNNNNYPLDTLSSQYSIHNTILDSGYPKVINPVNNADNCDQDDIECHPKNKTCPPVTNAVCIQTNYKRDYWQTHAPVITKFIGKWKSEPSIVYVHNATTNAIIYSIPFNDTWHVKFNACEGRIEFNDTFLIPGGNASGFFYYYIQKDKQACSIVTLTTQNDLIGWNEELDKGTFSLASYTIITETGQTSSECYYTFNKASRDIRDDFWDVDCTYNDLTTGLTLGTLSSYHIRLFRIH